jgi:hypothetical protein
MARITILAEMMQTTVRDTAGLPGADSTSGDLPKLNAKIQHAQPARMPGRREAGKD